MAQNIILKLILIEIFPSIEEIEHNSNNEEISIIFQGLNIFYNLKDLLSNSFPLFKAIENKSNLPENKVYDDDNIDNVIDYYKNYPELFNDLIDNQVDWVLRTNPIPLDPNYSTGEFNSKGFKPYDSIPMKNNNIPNDNNNLPYDNYNNLNPNKNNRNPNNNLPFNNKNPNNKNPDDDDNNNLKDSEPDNNNPNLRIIPHRIPRHTVPEENDSNERLKNPNFNDDDLNKPDKLYNDSQQPLYYQNITLPNDDDDIKVQRIRNNPKRRSRAKSANPGKKNLPKDKRLRRKIFGRIDLSRSGYLSYNEFERGFRDYFDPKVYKEVVRLTFQQTKNLSSRDPEIQENIKKCLDSKRKTLKGGKGQRIKIRDIDDDKIEFFEFEKALAVFRQNCIYFNMFKKICKVDESDVNFINKRKFNKEDFHNAKKKLIKWGLDKNELENEDNRNMETQIPIREERKKVEIPRYFKKYRSPYQRTIEYTKTMNKII